MFGKRPRVQKLWPRHQNPGLLGRVCECFDEVRLTVLSLKSSGGEGPGGFQGGAEGSCHCSAVQCECRGTQTLKSFSLFPSVPCLQPSVINTAVS